MTKHSFVVCAYKESEYLEQCIQSLEQQTVRSPIIVCTSTPCKYIEDIASRHSVKLLIRNGTSDIQADWNYAAELADSEWVTVAHQDDYYDSRYAEYLTNAIASSPDSIMFFTDYRPVIGGVPSTDWNCRIKHFLRSPMKIPFLSSKCFFKRRMLSLGNCICCPSVSYNKRAIDGPIFTSDLKFSLDWDTFLKFADLDGRFIYVDKVLTYYRIHNEATTMDFINNHTREVEDVRMFNKFWPAPITRLIMPFYKKSYNTYLNIEGRKHE